MGIKGAQLCCVFLPLLLECSPLLYLALCAGMGQVLTACSAPHLPEPREFNPVAKLLVNPRVQAVPLPAPACSTPPWEGSSKHIPCTEHTGTELGRTWFKKLHNSKTNKYKHSGVSNTAPAAPGGGPGPQPQKAPWWRGAWASSQCHSRVPGHAHGPFLLLGGFSVRCSLL